MGRHKSITHQISTLELETVNATANNANIITNITVTNPNIYVSTTGDDDTGDGSQINPYKTIK